MLPIIRWTLWQRKWSSFWWALGVVGLVVITLAFYPSIHNQAAQLQKSFNSLSSNTLALFGGTDFFSPVGYLNSQLIYFTLPLLLAILGIGLGSSLVGREESDGTLASLLSRPVSRSKLLAAKAISGAIDIFFITFAGSAAIILMAKAVNLAVPINYIAEACFMCFLLVLTFSAVPFLLAATGWGRAAAIGISVAYSIGGYVIGSLAMTVHWLKIPSLLFPYHYYRTADILIGKFDWSSVFFFVLFILLCGVLSWLGFRRRDLV